MADITDLSLEDPNDMQDYPDLSAQLIPPPEISYPDKGSLIAAVQDHGKRYGYNIVIKTSSIPNDKKPGRIAKVWLRCDRGGTYRPRNGLTEGTRKRKRTSRLLDCPFLLIATGSPGIWTVKVENGTHNHGPVVDLPRTIQPHKVKKGQIEAIPYYWPHDASFSKFTTAFVIVDMQRDFCETGGYLEYQGYDITATRALIPKLQHLLETFREAEFPVYHTREGHRPDLSTLSSREMYRSQNNATGFGVGSQGPLGRLLIRGEAGHDIVHELYPLSNEPIIDKPGRGAFAHTDFDLLLRIKGIKNLIIAGITTDVGVSTTMREANDRGYDCLLVEDATVASDPHLHLGACESIKMEGGIFGVTAKAQDIIDAIESFKVVAPKTVNKSGQAGPSNTSETSVAPSAMMTPVMSTPISASLAGPMPMSAGSIGTTFLTGTSLINGVPGPRGNNMIDGP